MSATFHTFCVVKGNGLARRSLGPKFNCRNNNSMFGSYRIILDGWSGSQPHKIRLSFMQRTQCIHHGLRGTRLGTEEATTTQITELRGETVFTGYRIHKTVQEMALAQRNCVLFVRSPTKNKKKTKMNKNLATSSNCTIFTLNDNIGNAFNSVACL